jgi:hypothetical protein
MSYSLIREKDGVGDSGSMSQAIYPDSKGDACVEENGRPRVGVQMKVGSYTARSMQWQDWWQTTFCLEIIEESENYVKFKTGNSVYEWKQF